MKLNTRRSSSRSAFFANQLPALTGLISERKPRRMVTDPPYGVELDSERRERADLNDCVPAEPSYLKKRMKGRHVFVFARLRRNTGRRSR